MLPDGAQVSGHAELRRLYEQRLALVAGVWSTELRNGTIDGKTSFEGIATLVFRRGADQTWRILIDVR